MQPQPKAFLEALNLIQSDPKKAKKFLEDKRLTLNEKKILNSWFLLKNCKHDEIIEALNELKITNYELVEGQRLLILGITFNNQAQSRLAISHITSAFEILEKYPLPSHHFIAVYNLFIAYLNGGKVDRMEDCLELMESILKNHGNKRQELYHLQCQFCFLVFTEQIPEAEALAKVIDQKPELMSDSMIMSNLLTKFNLQLKKEDLKAAENALEEIKKYRLFRFTAGFNFMRISLDHLLYGSPLYVYRENFKDCEYLFSHLKVVQALEENDPITAKRYWSDLVKHRPDIYHEDFTYHGEKNLFALCLKRHHIAFQKLNNETPKAIPTETSSNKSEALLMLLRASSLPIRKEVVFKALWGTEIESENDEAKIRNLISYVRKSKKINISFKRGCYFIATEKEEAA